VTLSDDKRPGATGGRTPLIVFAYNRPTHLARLLESLARCRRLDECEIYLHCDGPREGVADANVEATRRIAREWEPRLRARCLLRGHNLGLGRAIVGGVTELCSRQGQVIVLEDDLVVRPDFIDFMLRALARYATSPSVLQISGYMYGVDTPPSPDVYALPLTSGWGWATWKRAWDRFEWEPAGALAQLSDPSARRRFNLWDSYPYYAMLCDRLAGKNQSWGILWQWKVFELGGQVVYPRRSLVWNGGFDGSGTHSGMKGVEIPAPADLASPVFADPPELPASPQIDRRVLRQIAFFLRRQMGYPLPSWRERVLDAGREALGVWRRSGGTR
jgi:hypothetical protein